MRRVEARKRVGARVSAAEALWYDPSRWPTFVEGFHHVVRREGEWPDAGARLVWDSRPGGRGRVQERVVSHVVRDHQTVELEDPRLLGRQTVRFRATDDGDGDVCLVTLELEYELKDRGFAMPLVDLLFVRRALRDSLRRTLERFATELRAESEAVA